ncbi:hypothetical protein FGO68_gene16346 [Halteria grandinella]|uniref:Uncharacterized protein n=1 Tax=Halteria grandinella TaxID=5974 RepID=A0A8J8T0L3_HALGN|nr:hypothetical protein FGO68_gene16346 [Halteria grandinella]
MSYRQSKLFHITSAQNQNLLENLSLSVQSWMFLTVIGKRDKQLLSEMSTQYCQVISDIFLLEHRFCKGLQNTQQVRFQKKYFIESIILVLLLPVNNQREMSSLCLQIRVQSNLLMKKVRYQKLIRLSSFQTKKLCSVSNLQSMATI